MQELMGVHLSKIENKVCCGILEALHMAGYMEPFTRPLQMDMETSTLGVVGWCAHVYKLTPSGNISKKERTNMVLSYCPFCGKDIKDK